MSVILTGGQSWDKLATDYTLSAAYAPALANYNNMDGESITGKQFRVEIPDTWMLPAYAQKQIDLRNTGAGAPMSSGTVAGISPLVWGAIAIGALLLVK